MMMTDHLLVTTARALEVEGPRTCGEELGELIPWGGQVRWMQGGSGRLRGGTERLVVRDGTEI